MATKPASANTMTMPRSLWLFLVLLGLITLAGGILALVYPDITVEVLAIILGINLLLVGILDFVDAFTSDADHTGKTLQVLLGLVGLIAGIICLRRPSEALTFIVIVVAIWMVIAGIVLVLRAIFQAGNRAMTGLAGLIILAIGIAIISWPHIGLGTLVILVSIGLIIRGIYAIAAGFALKALTA
jgi:uncharacterized membrane protein HdeD (DUF308 family)